MMSSRLGGTFPSLIRLLGYRVDRPGEHLRLGLGRLEKLLGDGALEANELLGYRLLYSLMKQHRDRTLALRA